MPQFVGFLFLIILIFVSFSLALKRSPNSVHHLARLYAKCTKSPSFVGQQTAQNARHEKRLCSQLTTALLVSVAPVGDGGEKLLRCGRVINYNLLTN